MKASEESRSYFHCRLRDIAKHLQNGGARVSETMVKEIVKHEWGPRITITVGNKTKTIIKPSRAYTQSEMNEVTAEMEAWASTDLGLVFEESAA
jgi:antitoxin component of MazEF toxin-antitoxin module